jgi:hypothetical protein
VRRIRGYKEIRRPDPDDPGFRGYPTGRSELVDGDSMWMGSNVIIDVDVPRAPEPGQIRSRSPGE